VKDRWGGLYSLGAVGTSMEWLAENIWGGSKEAGRAMSSIRQSRRGSAVRTRRRRAAFLPPAGGHGEIYGVGRRGYVNLTLPHTRTTWRAPSWNP